jgi:hypothetical protein
VLRLRRACAYQWARGDAAALCAPRIEVLGLRSPDAAPRSAQLVTLVYEWYDAGMTRSKIAISLPKDQLARVHREVRAGRADSVSGYIARVLAEHEKRESLRALLRDLIEQYGEPATKDIKWAERALAPRRG